MLILGSLPGERSLAEGRYYAHPQNRFWHLIGSVIAANVSGPTLRNTLASLGYQERIAVLRTAGIGLWDTIASARRPGSLDAAISDAEHAPIARLAASLPELRAVGFNGRLAQKIATPQLANTDLALVPLPSSSPAHASVSLHQKEQAWSQLRQFLC